MEYKNYEGRVVDTDKEEIICPWCKNIILKEDIDNGYVYQHEIQDCIILYHEDCSLEAFEDEIESEY